MLYWEIFFQDPASEDKWARLLDSLACAEKVYEDEHDLDEPEDEENEGWDCMSLWFPNRDPQVRRCDVLEQRSASRDGMDMIYITVPFRWRFEIGFEDGMAMLDISQFRGCGPLEIELENGVVYFGNRRSMLLVVRKRGQSVSQRILV